jgi:DNA-binding GntR family transcriptional regulator
MGCESGDHIINIRLCKVVLMNNNKLTPNSSSVAEPASTYQQQVYDFVKAQIMNLELKPGQYITDSQIADEFEISRTPVREALRRLEQEGLLVNQARRGWKVYSLSLDDIHEIFDIKESLDGMIIRKAAECQDEDLRNELKQWLTRMKRATEVDNVDAWLEADSQLHETIYKMGGNERAARIMRRVNDQWYRLRIGFVALQGRMELSTPEHDAIVDRILAGDGCEADRMHGVHTNRVRQGLVRVLVNLVLPYAEEGV